MLKEMLSNLPIFFFILLAISGLISIIFLNPKTPISFIRIQVGFSALPPLVAFIALIFSHERQFVGPWYFDSLSWLLAFFVLTIGCIVQRYCVRYLLGDFAYRKYFALLTFTTTAASVTWISNDFRLLLVCWGATLLGLTFLIGLKKEWVVTKNAAKTSARLFAMSWGAFLVAIVWLSQATGEWKLSQALTLDSLSQLESWEKTCINLLLMIAVIIPAAQWPFQRWLLDSVVAPTPISAVMHAGIVNAGGIILTLFAPLFHGSIAQMALLIFTSISVLMGTGIMLVQVDYKRQLVGSTIAQMGFMLIQCALGAYTAAIIHAILHGLFKSTLFLQSGSVLHYHGSGFYIKKALTPLSILTGSGVGILTGVGFWFTSHGETYQLVSAFILGWSITLAWIQLVSFRIGIKGRIVGFGVLVGGAIVYLSIHHLLFNVINETVQISKQPPIIIAILLVLLLFFAIVIATWLTRNQSTKYYAILYLWLVRLGEPKNDVIESHPHYLTQLFTKGGKVL